MRPSHTNHYDHIICGGGLVGSLWALYLRKRNYSVAIFESYWDLRKEVIAEGRSINLILSRRAV
jgi:kynurenine 3-monooxygenase